MSALQIISLSCWSVSLVGTLLSRPLAHFIVWLTVDRPLERLLRDADQ